MGSGLVLTALHRMGDEIPVDITLNPMHVNGSSYMLALLAICAD